MPETNDAIVPVFIARKAEIDTGFSAATADAVAWGGAAR